MSEEKRVFALHVICSTLGGSARSDVLRDYVEKNWRLKHSFIAEHQLICEENWNEKIRNRLVGSLFRIKYLIIFSEASFQISAFHFLHKSVSPSVSLATDKSSDHKIIAYVFNLIFTTPAKRQKSRKCPENDNSKRIFNSNLRI